MDIVESIVNKVQVTHRQKIEKAVLAEIHSVIDGMSIFSTITLNDEFIKKALSKEVPRKIIFDRECYPYCPNCHGSYLLNKVGPRDAKYCPECGQKLEMEA